MTHFFALGELLEARCKELIPELKHTAIVRSINEASNNQQYSPAVYVVPISSNPTANKGRLAQTNEQQRWSVVLAIHHAASQADIKDMLTKAGDYLEILIKGLQGHKFNEVSLELNRVGGDRFGYSPAFSYFPLTFETQFVI